MEFKLFGFINIKIRREVLEGIYSKLREKIVEDGKIDVEYVDLIVNKWLDDIYG